MLCAIIVSYKLLLFYNFLRTRFTVVEKMSYLFLFIYQIKRYPNVLVLATSNVTGVIDPAFLDRADIRLFIGPPSAPAIYTIFRSCLQELIRVGLVEADDDNLLSYQAVAAMQLTENKVCVLFQASGWK